MIHMSFISRRGFLKGIGSIAPASFALGIFGIPLSSTAFRSNISYWRKPILGLLWGSVFYRNLLKDLLWTGTRFVAVGDSSGTVQSTDGTTWTVGDMVELRTTRALLFLGPFMWLSEAVELYELVPMQILGPQ